ncbi:MAG: FkbM family methyltransferase [Candidatus Promineifilaceae bacterium]|nr:FkbM family methyltransferase [Candidatus Promineifilaceae bacterium]
MPFRGRKAIRFYRPFIKTGDLCFDIGAHVGNRMRSWLKLGAHVVALEPQPHLMNFLRRWYADREEVVLLQQAVGAEQGQTRMFISRLTPTVTSLSRKWITTVREDRSFRSVNWDDELTVTVTTLDQLIEQFGMPVFCKIDVEGYEAEVLKGLSRPVPMLSFEYIPATIAIAVECIALLSRLGSYEFNWSQGENFNLLSASWLDANSMVEVINTTQAMWRSGDIYARLKNSG